MFFWGRVVAKELAPPLAGADGPGYAHPRIHTGEDRAVRKAIRLDQSDPLPRLGLGLAQIRDGALAEGSKEIEVAVSFDFG
jgi:hypothetical protein